MSDVITVTRPPLNLYESVRLELSNTGVWTPVYSPVFWKVLATPIDPETVDSTAALISNAYVCPLGLSNSVVSVRVFDGVSANFPVILNASVSPGSNLPLNLRRAIIKSGEELQALLVSGPPVTFNVSFILNTKERLEEVV
jgi:hypothetical protein